MAIQNKGVLGHPSGKIGEVVYSSWKGINYVKSKSKPSSKPKTVKQLAQQAKFCLAVRFLNPVKGLLNIGFQELTKRRTAHNIAMTHMLREVISGEHPEFNMDYSKVQFSRGSWGKEHAVRMMPGVTSLGIFWCGDVFQLCAYGDDQVYILIYEPERNIFIQGPSNVQRMHGACIISIPDELLGKTLHAYLFCVSGAGKVSDTTYAGEAIVPNLNHQS